MKLDKEDNNKENKKEQKHRTDGETAQGRGHKKQFNRQKQLAWDKLDNTANLFPVIASEQMSNVYRISVSLTEEVDRVLLQEALDRVLPQFLVFRMRLRTGVFWYYFEENTKPAPFVRQEYRSPGAYIDKSKNNQYMFRVTYYKCRINLEVFHALTDGSGGMMFFKELIYQYLRLKYPELLAVEKDKISSGIFLDQEDSYIKNFKKGHEKVYQSNPAVCIKGEHFPRETMGVIHGYFPVEQLKAVSKGYGMTINQYLAGVYVYSIYKEYLKGQPSKEPINCCVPVNLRPYYDSHTMKNFFAMVSAVFRPEREDYTMEEVLSIVANSLKQQITPENLNNIMSYNVSNETNWILRAVPLAIKRLAIRFVYGTSAKATTTTMTNIGNIELREPYKKYVEHFYATLSMSKGQNIKGSVCSYNGVLVFTFSSILRDLSIQKRFFQTIAGEGVSVAVESNGVYYE